MNKIVGEDTSLDKDSDASLNIIKPSPIDGRRALGNTRIKRKLSVILTGMVDIIE
jgi:hypothetical protein